MCNYKGDTSSDVLIESPPPPLMTSSSSALGPHHFQVFIIPAAESSPRGSRPVLITN